MAKRNLYRDAGRHPPRETGAVFLFCWILFLLIPFVLPFCMASFFSDLFHFFPSFALLSFFLSFLISLITFLSLHFSVNFFFLFFSFHLLSLSLSFCFLLFHFCRYLFNDAVFVAESLMLILRNCSN